MTAALFERQREPGAAASAALAALVHLALVAILVFGVRWQNRPADPVVVELWSEPPPAALEAPKPPPDAEPAPEPRIDRPDIALREAAKPKPKPDPKPAPQKPKAQPPGPSPAQEAAQRRLHEELAREQRALEIERERQANRERLAREDAARALAGWTERIRAKIRGNLVLPQDLKGNPEAIFDVVLLPTGEVLSAKLRKSSGHRGYDEAIERAILKSSPLPKPDRAELFQRRLELRFRPLDPL